MFPHAKWHERLYVNPYEPAIDETLETYSKLDGSRWLSYRRASPSFGRLIEPAPSGEQYDVKKELDSVRITSHEVALPAEVANEMGLLWRTMLPGLPKNPIARKLVIHAPAFTAFFRDDGSVKAGMIAMAAYDTPAYRQFAGIVDDLIKAGQPGASKQQMFTRLTSEMRNLRARLEKP